MVTLDGISNVDSSVESRSHNEKPLDAEEEAKFDDGGNQLHHEQSDLKRVAPSLSSLSGDSGSDSDCEGASSIVSAG